jgi:hypothetical protein
MHLVLKINISGTRHKQLPDWQINTKKLLYAEQSRGAKRLHGPKDVNSF